jgi:hypothetical protein
MLLEVAPASFDVIQLGGVFGQPLDGEPGTLGGAVCGAELVEQGDKVGRALGGAGMHEKTRVHRIKGPEHCLLLRLTGGLDAQLRAAPGPAACQIGMRERLGLVEKHQIDRPRRSLGFQIGKALAAGRERGCVLPPFEGVARPSPSKPLWRN